MIAVEGSRQIAGYAWRPYDDDPDVGDLDVEFIRGDRWRYAGVPLRVLEEFLLADSKGAFLRRVIVPGYAGARLAENPTESHQGP